MNKFILGFVILTLATSGILFPLSDFKIEKDINLARDGEYRGSIVSIKGKLNIDGTVTESILIMGGQVTLDGVVEEDVICVASTVKINKNAVIKRDLFVIGGQLEKDPAAKVEGEFFNFKLDLKRIENNLIPILSDSSTLSFFKAVKIIIWFIITLIVFAVIPRRIHAADEIFDNHHIKIGVIGLVGLFTFIFLLFIAILLSFVFIGIPILIVLLLLYLATFVFGRTVMYYHIGTKLTRLFKIKHIAPAFFILGGALIYAILKFIPVVGAVLLILINIFELGIGVSYFLRKRLKF